MKKNFRLWLCVILFLITGMGMIYFLKVFTEYPEIPYIAQWDEVYRIEEDGTKVPVEMDEYGNYEGMASGALFEMSTTISLELEAAYIYMMSCASEVTMLLDGEQIWQGTITPTEYYSNEEVCVTLPDDYNGKRLTVQYRNLGDDTNFMTPFVNITSMRTEETMAYAYANYYAIQLGVISIVFAIICIVFMVGIYIKKINLSLIFLALGTAANIIHNIVLSLGYYFLPEKVNQIFSSQVFEFLPVILIFAYFIANYKRGYFKILGMISACMAAFLGVMCIISLCVGSSFAPRAAGIVQELFAGNYGVIMWWLQFYLIVVGVLATVYDGVWAVLREHMEKSALALKNEVMQESCHSIEENARSTMQLRHEMRKHIQVINMLCQSEEYEKIGAYVKKLDEEESSLAQTYFTGHFLLNILMQNYAVKAVRKKTKFDASISVPDTLNMEENDLSSLVMNMLDNAVEACENVSQEKRYIKFRMELKEGFLAVFCENSYGHQVKEGKDGHMLTSKEDKLSHGYGIRQMKKIAEKYGSILDINYTDDIFRVQTALKLKND